MTFAIILINPAILPKSMGFDCLWNYANKNIILRLDDTHSDSLVNDQVLSESKSNSERDASYTN